MFLYFLQGNQFARSKEVMSLTKYKGKGSDRYDRKEWDELELYFIDPQGIQTVGSMGEEMFCIKMLTGAIMINSSYPK